MRAVDNSPDGEMANEAVIEFKSNFAGSLSAFNLFGGAARGNGSSSTIRVNPPTAKVRSRSCYR